LNRSNKSGPFTAAALTLSHYPDSDDNTIMAETSSLLMQVVVKQSSYKPAPALLGFTSPWWWVWNRVGFSTRACPLRNTRTSRTCGTGESIIAVIQFVQGADRVGELNGVVRVQAACLYAAVELHADLGQQRMALEALTANECEIQQQRRELRGAALPHEGLKVV